MTPSYSEHKTPLAVLGTTVVINTVGCKLSAADENWAIALWRSAFLLLDDHAAQLPAVAIAAFKRFQEIIVPGFAEYLGDTGFDPTDGLNGTTLSLPYLRDWSTAAVATLLVHEGTHDLDRGKWSGDDLWLSEKDAVANQVAVLEIVGGPQNEIDYLKSWGADSNRAAMQLHMTGGYTGPPSTGQ